MANLIQKLGAMKVTVSKFYLPQGDSTQLRGVSSDTFNTTVFHTNRFGTIHRMILAKGKFHGVITQQLNRAHV